MRYLAVGIVCLAVGFGAGYLAFDWPFGGTATSHRPDPLALAREAAEAKAGGDIQTTSCSALTSPPDVYRCTVYRPFRTNEILPVGTYRIVVNGARVTSVQYLGIRG